MAPAVFLNDKKSQQGLAAHARARHDEAIAQLKRKATKDEGARLLSDVVDVVYARAIAIGSYGDARVPPDHTKNDPVTNLRCDLPDLHDLYSLVNNICGSTSCITAAMLDSLVSMWGPEAWTTGHHYYPAALLAEWTNLSSAQLERHIQAIKRNTQEDNSCSVEHGASEPTIPLPTALFPCQDIPPGATHISTAYNPTGDHWIHVEFAVDTSTIPVRGNIITHDPLFGGSGGRGAARTVLPLLAQLIALRPGCGWKDVDWARVRTPQCPAQRDSTSLGLITAHFCWQRLRGISITNTLPQRELSRYRREVVLSQIKRLYDIAMPSSARIGGMPLHMTKQYAAGAGSPVHILELNQHGDAPRLGHTSRDPGISARAQITAGGAYTVYPSRSTGMRESKNENGETADTHHGHAGAGAAPHFNNGGVTASYIASGDRPLANQLAATDLRPERVEGNGMAISVRPEPEIEMLDSVRTESTRPTSAVSRAKLMHGAATDKVDIRSPCSHDFIPSHPPTLTCATVNPAPSLQPMSTPVSPRTIRCPTLTATEAHTPARAIEGEQAEKTPSSRKRSSFALSELEPLQSKRLDIGGEKRAAQVDNEAHTERQAAIIAQDSASLHDRARMVEEIVNNACETWRRHLSFMRVARERALAEAQGHTDTESAELLLEHPDSGTGDHQSDDTLQQDADAGLLIAFDQPDEDVACVVETEKLSELYEADGE